MKSLPYILLKSKFSKSFALFRIKENLIEYTGNGLILCAFGRSYWKYTLFYDSNCEISFYLHLAFLLEGFQVDSHSVVVSANQKKATNFGFWTHSIILLQSELILDRASNKNISTSSILVRTTVWEKCYISNVPTKLVSEHQCVSIRGARTKSSPEFGSWYWRYGPSATNCPEFGLKHVISNWTSKDASADPWFKIVKN